MQCGKRGVAAEEESTALQPDPHAERSVHRRNYLLCSMIHEQLIQRVCRHLNIPEGLVPEQSEQGYRRHVKCVMAGIVGAVRVAGRLESACATSVRPPGG